MAVDVDKLWGELDALGPETVKKRLAQQVYGPDKIGAVSMWLTKTVTEAAERRLAERRAAEDASRAADAAIQERRHREALEVAREANALAGAANTHARRANLVAAVALIASVVALFQSC